MSTPAPRHRNHGLESAPPPVDRARIVPSTAASVLSSRFERVRAATEALCAPLQVEDYGLQSMPDASPAKWHLAHTSWFFETFVLAAFVPGHAPLHAGWDYLFNSYYEAIGPRHPRPERGLLTRPTVAEVYAYRAAVNERVMALLQGASASSCELLRLVELGLQHEQQHQELLLTDIQHGLSRNPLRPALHPAPPARLHALDDAPASWIERPGGVYTIGRAGSDRGDGHDFAFDNESPEHRVYLEPFAIASRPVSCGQYAEFIADGGYRNPDLWLSEGWATVCAEGWQAPLYWEAQAGNGSRGHGAGGWRRFSLYGMIDVDPAAPVCHVSLFEADAFARWAGARLPSEAEWELVASELPHAGQFIEDGMLVPSAQPASPMGHGLLGGVWTWTSSAYCQYPGYVRPEGAIGEYNAKFMVNQIVLRGGSCFSPRAHLRPTYRNFFPPHARWQVSGIRLAR